jgi:hypothetical protein
MARALGWVAVGAALMIGPAVLAQTAHRLSDKDVRALIDVVDQGRDRFEDRLDGKIKNSVLRLSTGEVNVARFLDDFQENLDRLKERFKPEYAASAEAAAVLRQGTAIHTFMKEQPADLKGASEWYHLADSLGRLAGVYGTKFPLAGDAAVRRISDGEAAAAAEQIEDQAGQFKAAVNREPSLAPAAKDGLKGSADVVRKSAKALASRLKDSKPATAEARMLFDAIDKLQDSSESLGLAAPSLSLMGAMRAPLATLRQAFGVEVVAGT